jgi:hypothetical protein
MTNRPFAYNPSGVEIAGTIQLGTLSIGTPTTGFTDSPVFWGGPDEELGYVICVPVPDNSQPTEIPGGVTGSVAFWRSSELTDASFISVVNGAFGQKFVTPNQCLTYLNDNGYWTSYEAAPPTTSSLLIQDGSLFLLQDGNKLNL